MSHSIYPYNYGTYPETPVCNLVSTTWNASRSELNGIHD